MKYWLKYLVLLLALSSHGQVVISGRVALDSTWSRQIYASRIPTMADIYNASNHFVFASAEIDSSGHWQLEVPRFTESRLIRLHTKKIDQPVNSLIKGTKDQNFGLIAIQPGRDVTYYHPEGSLFLNFNVRDSINFNLRRIDSVIKKWEQIDQHTLSYDERMQVRRDAADALIYIADSTSNVLTAVYALKAADFGFNQDAIREKMAGLSATYGEHPYIENVNSEKDPLWFKLVVAILLLVVLSIAGYRAFTMYNSRKEKLLLNQLTIREREVLQCVKSGKTNKEVASHLNIELNTVKTHLKNSFKKLGINSRNELFRFKF